MKKILAVALACTVSSFAAWDKFPVIEEGKGQVKIGTEQSRQSTEEIDGGFGVKVRYSPMANLELTAQNWGDALGNYALGARYQILPGMLSAGVEVGFPLNTTAWSFKPGVQFSMELSPALSLGAGVDLSIYTETSESAGKYARGMDLDGGIELDFTMGQSTIWVAFDAKAGLGTSSVDGTEFKDVPMKLEGRELKLTPAVGYFASIKETIEVGTWVGFTIGSVNNDEADITTIVGIDASVKF